MDLSLRVLDYIHSFAYQITTSEGTLTASQMLERFLFPSSSHSTTLARLSGGERRRLFLLSILMQAPNVLLFDEPTNDLDIQTLSILEDYLDSFPGAVIVISHDRYFLDRVVQRIFSLEGNGSIAHYPGGYTDYIELHQEEERERQEAEKASLLANKKKSPASKDAQVAKNLGKHKDSRLKFSFNEQREFETIEDDIATLERQLSEMELQMSKEASNYDLLQEMLVKKQAVDQELSLKLDRWVYLNDLADKINN
jgi:ABC transport system ATP-binding/permease protein